MEKVQLLIIDEHEAVRNALATRLSSNPNIEVVATIQSFNQQNLNDSGSADVALYGLKSSSDADLDATISVVEDLTCQGTAVIVLTSYADDIERELLLKSGAYRYLLKNINSNKLIAEILEVAAETTAAVTSSKTMTVTVAVQRDLFMTSLLGNMSSYP